MTQQFAQDSLAIMAGLLTGSVCGIILSAIIMSLRRAGHLPTPSQKSARQERERPWAPPPGTVQKEGHHVDH